MTGGAMGMIAKVRGAVRGAVMGARGQDVRGKSWAQLFDVVLRGTGVSNSIVWQSYSTSQLERIGRESAVVYACVNKITSAFCEAPLKVVIKDADGELQSVPNDPLAELLHNPCEQFSGLQYRMIMCQSMLLTGESYTIQVRGANEQTMELVPVPTSWVQPVVNMDGVVIYYNVMYGNGRMLTIYPVDMVRIWYPDPADPTKALGPLQAALRSYQSDDEREAWTIEMLQNMHLPSMVLRQTEPWTDEQMKAAREKVRDVIGPGKRGSPLFIWGQEAAASFIQPPADIDLPGLATMAETRICACFGVPVQTVGLRAGETGKTFSNYEEANRAFVRQTMVPMWTLIGEMQTSQLIVDEGDVLGRHIVYDFTRVREMQDDQAAISARIIAEWQNGLRTRGEARAALGLDALAPDKSDVLAMPMNLIEQSTGDGQDITGDETDHLQTWQAGNGESS